MNRLAKFLGIFAALAVLNLVTVALFLVNLPRTVAGPGSSTDCVAGDVNGDGTAGIGDVIHLATYLFQEGPEPVACAADTVRPRLNWPPAPRHRVTLAGVNEEVDAIGDQAVVYTVPKDRHLVLRDLASTFVGRRQDQPSGTWQMQLFMSLGDTDFVRVYENEILRGTAGYDRFIPPDGWVFSPGSEVRLELGLDTGWPTHAISWCFTGYLIGPDGVDATLYPPAPEDLVDLRFPEAAFPRVGDELTLFDVPEGKHLVVNAYDCVALGSDLSWVLRLMQRNSKGIEETRLPHFMNTWTISALRYPTVLDQSIDSGSVVFEPGTEVVLQRVIDGSADFNLSAGELSFDVHLAGHLVSVK